MVKRLYIPLPDLTARRVLIQNLMAKQVHSLSDADIECISIKTEGYSGSDMRALCTEAAMGPIRSLGDSICSISASSVRPISLPDFEAAMKQVRASVSQKDLQQYVDWNQLFGSFSIDAL
eukprot:TRINITY_DN7691_c0_g3_i3.p1 TRINITY_DN7691_c0_g3~~TRINITY_DN7691_c0_g3_i3.p1  ORF type:complete len:120 (+),score=16.77 TRINITY_DN7691_c0_g3_i3:263-622(+)